MKVKVIMTCFNRKAKTINCIDKLSDTSENVSFIIVDDNSSDGTPDAIENINVSKTIVHGDGNLYWAGGMRKGIELCLKEIDNYDYVMLVNDDVDFYPKTIDKMIETASQKPNSIIVGACCDNDGNPTYGAVKLNGIFSKKMYRHLSIKENDISADTFNCNAVLMPAHIMKNIGNFDPVYTHNFADYDYGFMAKKAGYNIFVTPFYVGVCSDDAKPSKDYTNRSLSRRERFALKELPKGLPQKEWEHFLLKNLGLIYFARYAYTAKIKILLGI